MAEPLVIPTSHEEAMKRWGFVHDLLATKASLELDWMKTLHEQCILQHVQGLEVEDKVAKMKTWVRDYASNKYLECLEDTSQKQAKALFKKMSPLDHVIAVLACIDRGEASTVIKKDKLAAALFDYG